MNKEVKTRWLEALRSGEYAQTMGRLRSPNNEFCCLGVLCDIIDPAGWDSIRVEKHRGHYSLPGEAILGESGLRRSNDHLETLIDMNDNKGTTFLDIADWIEVNL